MSGTKEIDLPYVPRWYQIPIEKALFSGINRIFICWHRRAGKDVACFNLLLNEAIKKPGLYHYVYPSQRQGRKALWDNITNDGLSYLNFVPKEIIRGEPNKTEMKFTLFNGSMIQVVGANNPDAVAGSNPRGVVFSEYSLQDPKCWELIYSPILKANGGFAIFNGTPRGKNHQYYMHVMARNNEKWFVHELTIEDTKLISEELIEEERREGKSEEIIQQEYYLSYDRGIEGSYYGRYIDTMRQEGRVGKVLYDKSSLVDTVWDLGYGDSTAVIFTQRIGVEEHIIDYYECSGEGLDHYVNVLKSKEYNYGTHFAPHDVESGHLGIGMTMKRFASELGINFYTLEKSRLEAGIEAARAYFSNLYIDEQKCRRLIDCLENYTKKYNKSMQCYSNVPNHNEFSHGADAFRYLAQARKTHSNKNKLTAEQIQEMRMRHRVA